MAAGNTLRNINCMQLQKELEAGRDSNPDLYDTSPYTTLCI